MTTETNNDANELVDAPIKDILEQRGSRYGSFPNQAALSQALKNGVMQHYFTVHGGQEAAPLEPYIAEAIAMICHKLARIANGDPYYADSWKDISGYSELVANELLTKTEQP